MDEILYSALNKYFLALSNLGYVKYNNVYKILFLIAVQELIINDYNRLQNEDDCRSIQNAIYKVFGTSCIITFPKGYNSDIIYSESSSNVTKELIDTIERMKKEVVVKTKNDGVGIEIADIVL